MIKQIKFLATAATLLVFNQTCHAAAIAWDNGGVDSEWNTVDNWDGGALPGTSTIDRANIGLNDNVVVTTAVTTSFAFDISLTGHSATLAIGADMSPVRRLTSMLGTVTQTAGALQFTDTGIFSKIDGGTWTISGGSLGFNGDLAITGGALAVEGNSASVSIGNGTGDNLSLSDTGGLDFTMNGAGVSAIAVADTFEIAATSLLDLDLTGFSGTGTFDLVTYTTILGAFDSGNITGLTGLSDGRTATLGYDTDSMFVTVAIPEPGTYALLSGLTGVACVMARRRRG